MQLLNPFEVDDANHAHQQVGVPRDIDPAMHDGAVQPLVEQQVGPRPDLVPRRERTRRLTERRRLLVVVKIPAGQPRAGCAVAAEQRLEFGEQIRRRAEMADVIVSLRVRLFDERAHLPAVVAVKRVALDDRGVHPFASENLLEG